MSAKYKVEIVKLVLTCIEVEAVTFASARRQLESYGLTEAINDYPVLNEDVEIKIRSLVKV